MTETGKTPELVGTAEASKIVAVNRRTLLRLIDRGSIRPAMKIPGTRGAYLFDRDEIEALAKDRRAS